MTDTVTAPQLKEWLDRNEAVLIDVREPAEYRAEHIPGATLMPLGQLTPQSLPPHKGKKLVFQCKSGKRGGMACGKLATAKAYNLDGGIAAWTQAGYAVETSGRPVLPLDRQVQVFVGLCVLTGSILSYAVSPAFLLVTGFFGAGLLFAGITGFCGLARLLPHAPWNK